MQVYKIVSISEDEQDTIIGFYNRVYMPAMKDIILQFTTKKQVVTSDKTLYL